LVIMSYSAMAQGEFFSMGTALLRYLYLFYQTAHWQSSGQSFYSAHQMFERLYSEALVDLDEWAERSIGVFNKEMVDFGKQMDLLTKLTLKYPVDQGYYAAFLQNGIKVEGEFQRYLKILKSGLERAIREKSMDENMEWISKQPLIYSFIYPSQKRYTFVHGGITPRMTWEKISNDIDLVYCRAIGKFGKSVSTFFNKETGQWEFREPDVIVWHELYNGRFGYVVSGHAPLKNGEPKFYKNSCNIDTACFITGKLTGLLLSENSMEHVQIHGPAAQPSDLPD